MHPVHMFMNIATETIGLHHMAARLHAWCRQQRQISLLNSGAPHFQRFTLAGAAVEMLRSSLFPVLKGSGLKDRASGVLGQDLDLRLEQAMPCSCKA